MSKTGRRRSQPINAPPLFAMYVAGPLSIHIKCFSVNSYNRNIESIVAQEMRICELAQR